jgi:hypothetical protein
MAVYYVYSGAAGANNGISWANAFTTLTAAFVTEAAGDTLYVAHDHAETTAGAVTLTSSGTIANPSKVVCVNRAGSVPPVSADRRATATVTTTGANNLTITGWTHYDGIIFNCGSGGSGASNLIIGSVAHHWLRFDNCSLRLLITVTGSAMFVGGSAGSLGGTCIELNNTTMQFGHAGHLLNVTGMLKWRNTASALLGTIPTVLFTPTAARGSSIDCIGVDFSAAGSGKTIAFAAGSTSQAVTYRFLDCKLDAAVTKAEVPSGYGTNNSDFIRSGSAGTNYTVHSQRISGLLTEETTVVRTGGASDGTTPIAWKIVTTANCTYSMPFECPPIAIWNDTTGSARTATVQGIWGGGAVPNDDEIWLEVEYLGDASSPQASFVNDGKANLLATAAAQTAASETWGGSTTDFALAVTFTAQQKGWIYARVKCATASTTFYVDPLVTLT